MPPRAVRKITRIIANVPEIIGGVAMAAITLILFAGVIWRYVFTDPLTWSDEVARVLFAWLAFIGAAVGVKRRLHSAVTLLGARLTPRGQQVIALIGLVAVAVMAIVLLYAGGRETIANFRQVMPITGLSRGWLYLAVPVSGFLILVYLVPQFRTLARGGTLRASHEPTGAE